MVIGFWGIKRMIWNAGFPLASQGASYVWSSSCKVYSWSKCRLNPAILSRLPWENEIVTSQRWRKVKTAVRIKDWDRTEWEMVKQKGPRRLNVAKLSVQRMVCTQQRTLQMDQNGDPDSSISLFFCFLQMSAKWASQPTLMFVTLV